MVIRVRIRETNYVNTWAYGNRYYVLSLPRMEVNIRKLLYD